LPSIVSPALFRPAALVALLSLAIACGDDGPDGGVDAASTGGADAAAPPPDRAAPPLDAAAAPAPDTGAARADAAPGGARDGGAAPAPATFVPATSCPVARLLPGREVTCGHVVVPPRAGVPGGKRADLAVLVVHGGTPARGEPVAYLAGGPGSSGVLEVAGLLSLPDNPLAPLLAAGRDVVAIDQRGTGSSVPSLDCPELEGLRPPAVTPGMMTMGAGPQALEAVRRCRARLVGAGIAPDQVTTSIIADDLALVQAALGHPRWALLGTSYGTLLGLELMRRHPGRVAAAILDSVLPPSIDLVAENAPGFDRALRLVFDRCAADAACAAAHPALEATFAALVAKLDATPARIAPPGEPPFTLNGAMAFDLVMQGLYDREQIEQLPRRIHAWSRGDFADVPELVAQAELLETFVSDGMHLSVMCADFVARASRPAFERRLAEVAASLRPWYRRAGEDYFDLCAAWMAAPAPAAFAEPVRSEIPTLVLAGELDPATPPAWAETVVATLPMARHALVRNASHGVLTSGCGAGLIAGFLNPAGFLDVRCAEPPLAFATGP
jgi:pimeloyl-ACP methyl ester carboxylesterase